MTKQLKKDVIEFLEDIPDDKINHLYTPGITPGCLFESERLRLDWQKFTSGTDDHKKYNVHVQTNFHNKKKSGVWRVSQSKSVAVALVPVDGSWTVDQIKEELIASFDAVNSKKTWTLYLWSSDPLVNGLPVEPQEFALEEGPRRDPGREEVVDSVVGGLVEAGDGESTGVGFGLQSKSG
ncbi:MAG: hypothetical protein M1826_005838 [Phylliscum demangeonii]|nr:MAG: hypothetical protein M1826_005838 [Phylliscum demangeonii]